MTKYRTLVACLLLCSSAIFAQTKEAAFTKVEALLKKSKGIKSGDLTLTDISFTESQIKIDMTGPEGKMITQYSKINWDEFSYSITPLKENESVSLASISVSEEMLIVTIENNKETDRNTEEEFYLVLKTSDVAQLRSLLDEMKTYTWKTLNKIRQMNKSELISYAKKALGTALEEDYAVVKNLYECEITIVNEDDVEFTIPTARLQIHSKDLLSTDYLFCYGKNKSMIKVTKDGTTTNKNVEHPELLLNFTLENDEAIELEYTFKRLSSFCQ